LQNYSLRALRAGRISKEGILSICNVGSATVPTISCGTEKSDFGGHGGPPYKFKDRAAAIPAFDIQYSKFDILRFVFPMTHYP
jgi:hypothetical protein